MSCNHCDTKFNFFHRELGCAHCGLSFCAKCLKQKCKLPSKGLVEFNVCRVCYSKLTSGHAENENIIIPPDRFLKRLETLENPAAPPITVYKQNPKINALKMGLSSADQQLVDRLEKLKEKQVLPPSDSELRERLAKLKGNSFGNTSEEKKHVFLPDTRSDQEKVDSILEQFSSEQGIDLSQSHDDLGQRLATLKGEEYKKNDVYPNLDESDSEDEVEKINRKIMAEIALDEKFPVDSSSKPTEDEDEDEILRPTSPELPWCVLCNGDAKYKCLDCGGDLYCGSCNTEVHKTWGDTDHRVIPYQPK